MIYTNIPMLWNLWNILIPCQEQYQHNGHANIWGGKITSTIWCWKLMIVVTWRKFWDIFKVPLFAMLVFCGEPRGDQVAQVAPLVAWDNYLSDVTSDSGINNGRAAQTRDTKGRIPYKYFNVCSPVHATWHTEVPSRRGSAKLLTEVYSRSFLRLFRWLLISGLQPVAHGLQNYQNETQNGFDANTKWKQSLFWSNNFCLVFYT
jgi:hypothetical protein